MSWLKDGETVAKGDTLSLQTNRSDSGKYWCFADNGLGDAIETTAHLDVQCKCGEERLSKVGFFR